MRFRTALILGALAVGLFVMPAGSALSQAATNTYVVQMLADPVVAYDGGVSGLEATKPAKGQKIDPRSNKVQKYADHLRSSHASAIEKAGGGQKLYDYVYSYNGFAAQLTEAQAETLKALKGVVAVTKDELQTADTSSTPAFLGLTAANGLWQQLGGKADGSAGGKDSAGPGEDVVIGVVDSGIWPESKSFSDRDASGKLVYQQVPGWHGKCTPGENFNASMCGQKLIGAQYFNAAWGGSAGVEALRPWEFQSPRDYNGHGTHTASTAGGNNGVQATGPAAVFGKVSGMAPRARISAYKALWSTQDGSTASGFTSDLAAAIDQAVADGVDVINYSVSGATTNFLDPVQVAFLFAADAGVFVSASAGNSGPAVGTVAHPSPWLTTVAAGTHNRTGTGSVTLGNGSTYTGASLATKVGPASLVNSSAIANTGQAAAANLCFSKATNGGVAALNPALAAGKIVVCIRGTNARTDKSLAVQEAGGVGMILINPAGPPGSLNADFHFVPTVHLQNTDLAAVQAYAGTAGATATINAASVVLTDPAPFTAAFSSRGPSPAASGDILKPDVIAPGQDILAAVAPPGNAGRDFNLLSGTSMSAPHVAGLAALLRDKHPTWSPMAIKSALMTSGSDILDGPNTNPLVIFRQGAGHVRPNNAADPGLVFNHGFNDWLAFLCGTTTGVSPATCSALVGLGYSLEPSNLNSASIALGAMAGLKTVTRKVTNVSGQAESYTAVISGLTGINAVVSTIGSVGAGETKSFTVAFTQVSAPVNSYTGGQLTLTGSRGHVVRIPIVIRPVALAAPIEVSSNGSAINYNVTFGYTGSFTATARGLVPATVNADTVADDPADGACTTTSSAYMKLYPVTIAAGTTLARFSLFDADVTAGSDIDLCLFNSGGTLVASSTSGTSAEVITRVNPDPGNYTVVVHGWGVPGSSPYKLHSWQLGSAAVGNMAVTAPASASLGTSGTIGLTFSGLGPATRYLGSVAYSGTAGMPNPTIVSVSTP